jgi:hypothetical protein
MTVKEITVKSITIKHYGSEAVVKHGSYKGVPTYSVR